MDPAGGFHSYGSGSSAYWKVFKNTGAGFSSTATNWSLPDNSYFSIGWSNSPDYWTTIDMDGDGRPDLVRTMDPSGGFHSYSSASAGYWKVFKNTGSGFSATATNWPLPDNSYFSIGWSNSPDYWTTIDLDGDGRPDLVRTMDPSGGFHSYGSASAGYWKVFKNTGTGFSATATNWSLPDNSYFSIGWSSSPDYWTTIDLDGDGQLDLVRTMDPMGGFHSYGSASAGYWKVFKNTGAGFSATATTWSLPDNSYFSIGWSSSPDYWTTFDLGGDGRADLVRTMDPEGGFHSYGSASAGYWKVFKNTGTGFSATATNWSLPDNSYFSIGWSSSPDYWTTIDLAKSGCPSLVRTMDPQNSFHAYGAGASSHWTVFSSN